MAIVALFASIAAPLTELVVQRGKKLDLRRALREIRDAIVAYKQHATTVALHSERIFCNAQSHQRASGRNCRAEK